KLAAHELLLPLELAELLLDVDPEPRARVLGRERAATARVPLHELPQRVRPAFEKCVRKTGRRHHAERVPIATRILGRDQTLLARDPHTDGAALGLEDRGERLVELADAEVAAQPQ